VGVAAKDPGVSGRSAPPTGERTAALAGGGWVPSGGRDGAGRKGWSSAGCSPAAWDAEVTRRRSIDLGGASNPRPDGCAVTTRAAARAGIGRPAPTRLAGSPAQLAAARASARPPGLATRILLPWGGLWGTQYSKSSSATRQTGYIGGLRGRLERANLVAPSIRGSPYPHGTLGQRLSEGRTVEFDPRSHDRRDQRSQTGSSPSEVRRSPRDSTLAPRAVDGSTRRRDFAGVPGELIIDRPSAARRTTGT